MKLIKYGVLWLALAASAVACSDAELSSQSLGLQSNRFSLKQAGSSQYLKVNSTTGETYFTITCPENVTELFSDIADPGGELTKQQDLDCSTGTANVNYTFQGATFTQRQVKFLAKGEDVETRLVETTFVRPAFFNAATTVGINGGAATTNTMAVTLGLNGYSTADSLIFSPYEVYITGVAGCGSGGNWVTFSNTLYGTFLSNANALNYVYIKYRDEANNESNCVYAQIEHDGSAPIGNSILINGGAVQTQGLNGTLAISASGADLYEMKISNNNNCSGGVWEPYATAKNWTLSGPGVNHVSAQFRDDVGNVSNCIFDTIVYDTIPPEVPTSLQLGSGITNPDNLSAITIVVSPVIAGDTARVFTDSSCSTEVGSATGGESGSASVSIAVNSDGMTQYWSQVTDPGAFVSACSTASVSYTRDTATPTVTNVTSPLADADYTTGSTLGISVVFDEAVYVTGTPTLELDVNGAMRSALYFSGSGTSTLTFRYVVQGADAESDLDYSSTTALQAAGGTIQDVIGNDADLTLPAPGAAGSLGNNKNLQLNFNVSIAEIYPPVFKIYHAGDEISAVVRFSAPVNVSGTPRLKAMIGTGSIFMNYMAAYRNLTGAQAPLMYDELYFRGNIPAGQNDTDGIELASLDLNGGTITHYFLGSPAQLTTVLLPVTYSQTPVRPNSPVPMFSFNPARYVYNENSGTGSFTIVHSAASLAGTTHVAYKVMKYSTASSADHSLTSGTIAFSPLETSKTVNFNIVNDSLVEGTEAIYVSLWDVETGRSGGLTTNTNMAQILITDDEMPTIEQIALNDGVNSHACVRYSSGRLACSGANRNGQLGNGTYTSSKDLVTVFSAGVTDVAIGSETTCAVASGQLYCWGMNGGQGQAGTGNTTANFATPQLITGMSDVLDVELSGNFGCVLYDSINRRLTCWGYNYYYQLGFAPNTTRLAPVAASPILTGVTDFSLGSNHGCAINGTGLYCWGSDDSGQIGNGAGVTNAQTPTAISLAAYSPQLPAQVSLGAGFSCLRFNNGDVTCWGDSYYYRLGNNNQVTDLFVPGAIIDTGVTTLFDGSYNRSHSCAKNAAGNIRCWGGTAVDPPFFTSVDEYPVPTTLTEPRVFNAHSLFLAGSGTCYVTASRQEVGCSLEVAGALPYSGHLMQTSPVDFSDYSVEKFDLGYTTLCIVSAAGELRCSGSQYIGDGATGGNRVAPVIVARSGVQDVAVASGGTCMLKTDSSVWCWKSGTWSAGEGTTGSFTHPRPVGVGFESLKAGYEFFCGTRSGELYCWGDDDEGQLGNGATALTNRPQPTGLTNVIDYSLGSFHACARGSDSVKCWGRNFNSQLGDGTNTNSPSPLDSINVYNLGVVSVHAGNDHSCFLFDDQSLRCWGAASAYQLGRGNTIALPFALDSTLNSVATAAAGAGMTCGVQTNGNLSCWGRNFNSMATQGRNMLGNPSLSMDYVTTGTLAASYPTLNNATQVKISKSTSSTSGAATFCALADSKFYCWGSNTLGLMPGYLTNDYGPRIMLGN